MIYIYGILFAVILSLGGLASCQHKEIVALEAGIEAQKLEAQRVYDSEVAKNKEITDNWAAYAKGLDNDHKKTIDGINSRRVPAVLFDPGRPSGCSPSPGKGDTGVPKDAPTGSQLSDQLATFLTSEANRADTAATYAANCRAYATKSIKSTIEGMK